MNVEVPVGEFEVGGSIAIEVDVAVVSVTARAAADARDPAVTDHGGPFLEDIEVEAFRPRQLLIGQVVARRDERLGVEL